MMRPAYLYVRSVILWTVSLAHFGAFTLLLLTLRLIMQPTRFEWLVRLGFRNIQRLAGIRVHYRIACGYDRTRTSLIVCNHVNLFDPFLVYPGVRQQARGLELESHFRIPVYGTLMRKFGNVPVPDTPSAAGLKRTFRLTREALDGGFSLFIFPEGSRTLTGRVNAFEDGAFVLAQKFKVPIVPVSIVGSFEFKRKGSWLLHPATVTVHVHDTVETADLARGDIPALRDRVHAIIAAPVDAHIRELERAQQDS